MEDTNAHDAIHFDGGTEELILPKGMQKGEFVEALDYVKGDTAPTALTEKAASAVPFVEKVLDDPDAYITPVKKD